MSSSAFSELPHHPFVNSYGHQVTHAFISQANIFQAYENLLASRSYCQRIEFMARKQTQGTSIGWEDAAQTMHMKVLQAIQAGKFRQGGILEFHRWCAKVARFEMIDLVRQEQRKRWISLDSKLPGTDLSLLDTLADELNLLDTVERSEQLRQALDLIRALDRQYPKRNYLTLWQERTKGKSQLEIARELGLTQGTISKRWRELSQQLTDGLSEQR
jgi:RNA polymerase sporulation-specific sigma factor